MIKKTIIYASFAIVLLFALQWLVLNGLKRNKNGIYEKYNTLFLYKNSYNTLILGSSRAEMHFDNILFDSLTGKNTYNAGISGATTRMAYVVLKSYLQNSSLPKTIFLECDFHRSNLKTDTIFNFPRLFPYLSNNTLYNQVKSIDARFTQFKYNPLFCLPYLGINYLNSSIHGWFNKTGIYDLSYQKGFFKNTTIDNYDHFKISTKKRTGFISQETTQYLDSIIIFCKTNHCKLLFTLSPTYKTVQDEIINKKDIIKQYENICLKHNIPLLNFSDDTTIINHKNYFEDNYHMLYSGARIYTQKIVNKLNNIEP